jgi:hypothetical protein
MMTRITQDLQKAKALRKVAEITLERLQATDTEKYPTNTLNDYYDIVHKMLEALSLGKGVKFKGDGAHQELIDFVCKEFSFPEQQRIFLQQMRDYINRIAYEGFIVTKEYIKLNEKIINEIIDRLLKLYSPKVFPKNGKKE